VRGPARGSRPRGIEEKSIEEPQAAHGPPSEVLQRRKRSLEVRLGPENYKWTKLTNVLQAQGANFFIDDYGRPVYASGTGILPLPFFDEYYPEVNIAKRCYVAPADPVLYCVRWHPEVPIEPDYEPSERDLIQYSTSFDDEDETRTQAPLTTDVTEAPAEPTEALTITFADAALLSTSTGEALPTETGEPSGESAGVKIGLSSRLCILVASGVLLMAL
jgi:hypothetical protein